MLNDKILLITIENVVYTTNVVKIAPYIGEVYKVKASFQDGHNLCVHISVYVHNFNQYAVVTLKDCPYALRAKSS